MDGLKLVAGGGDGGAKERFVQRLLAEDDGLALGMGGSDLLNGKGVANGVVDVRFAHAAHHAVDLKGRLDHEKSSFQHGCKDENDG